MEFTHQYKAISKILLKLWGNRFNSGKYSFKIKQNVLLESILFSFQIIFSKKTRYP